MRALAGVVRVPEFRMTHSSSMLDEKSLSFAVANSRLRRLMKAGVREGRYSRCPEDANTGMREGRKAGVPELPRAGLPEVVNTG